MVLKLFAARLKRCGKRPKGSINQHFLSTCHPEPAKRVRDLLRLPFAGWDYCFVFAFSATSALALSPIRSAAGGSWLARTTIVYGESSTMYRCVFTPGNPPPWPTIVRV